MIRTILLFLIICLLVIFPTDVQALSQEELEAVAFYSERKDYDKLSRLVGALIVKYPTDKDLAEIKKDMTDTGVWRPTINAPNAATRTLTIPLFPVLRSIDGKGKYGYIDKTGKVVIETRFDGCRPFSEGLAAVEIGHKWGFIDQSGKLVIPPKYDSVDSFSEGYATVKLMNKESMDGSFIGSLSPIYTCGVIDRSGRLVIGIEHEGHIGNFSEGYAEYGAQDFFGNRFITSSGKVIFDRRFDFVFSFSEGLASVEVRGKWGYINRSGDFVIEPKFDSAYPFTEGFAPVQIGEKWGYINQTGNIVIKATFDEVQGFSDGLSAVRVGEKWGYINRAGDMVIQTNFDSHKVHTLIPGAGSFSQGLAPVRIGVKWGYINTSGEIVINPEFNGANSFCDGLAEVDLGDGSWGSYIDKAGRLVWKFP